MALSTAEDLINFDLIEEHKENIQQLPGGRSVKQLKKVLSPTTLSGIVITHEDTKNLNDAIRREYEIELQSAAEHDDPLDIYQRYVKWTLDTWPQATNPQAQLCSLLERATKTFLNSNEYKNDPRYLKLWLHYIRLFSDAPRETFAFLARHGIAQQLALFYEEFAAWLENAGRWTQAEEVYKLGVEREARPVERLMRKYTQFQQRLDVHPADANEPSSPAMPKTRSALSTKLDPFAPPPRDEPQQRQVQTANTSKPKKQKMAIFSDASIETPPPVNTASTNGWDNISSIKDRKKENTVEAQSWSGQTLKGGKKVGSSTKIEIFKDPNKKISAPKRFEVEPKVNPKTGRVEKAFVNIAACYTADGTETSFEELRAEHRNWLNVDWAARKLQALKDSVDDELRSKNDGVVSNQGAILEVLTTTVEDSTEAGQHTQQSAQSQEQSQPVKQKKARLREIKQETQTVKARLDSPSRPRMKKKVSTEPTMTLHSKVAHNEIYNMYNNASKEHKDDTQSGAETDGEDDTLSVTGQSEGTSHISGSNSEYGDDTGASFNNLNSDETGNSPWSDFNTTKLDKLLHDTDKPDHMRANSEDWTSNMVTSQEQAEQGFDTQAIAAIAGQHFDDLDTMAIARIADGGMTEVDRGEEDFLEENLDTQGLSESEDLQTPTEPSQPDPIQIVEQKRYVPLPPEDYEPTPLRPWRNSSAAAHNKLPFMTPIVEQTESSLAPSTAFQQSAYMTKTPSRPAVHQASAQNSPSKLLLEDLLLATPPKSDGKRDLELEDEAEYSPPKRAAADSSRLHSGRILFPFEKATRDDTSTTQSSPSSIDLFAGAAANVKPRTVDQVQSPGREPACRGPIINDLQCNPCDQAVIDQILDKIGPSLSECPRFHSHQPENFGQFHQVRSCAHKVSKQQAKSSPRKVQNNAKPVTSVLSFPGASHVYVVKRVLGEGAFAPVFLAECRTTYPTDNRDEEGEDAALVAIKAEAEPKTLTWEFHVLELLRSRLGPSCRGMRSIIQAEACHLYRDECYLILTYCPQGTLLDLVNLVRAENVRAGKASEGLEEPVAVLFSVELLRTMEDVHCAGILHGDLKADNCLIRFELDQHVTGLYQRDGQHGWSSRGLTLIDFGRGIDMKAFRPEARFIADWKAGETDCAEIREQRPWRFEIDLFGCAGVIHNLLFGKYIETVAVDSSGVLGPGQRKEWKLREPLKRYWDRALWTDVFSTLINCNSIKEDEARRELVRLRHKMEDWLELEGERNGRDLRGSLRRCERLVGGNKPKERR